MCEILALSSSKRDVMRVSALNWVSRPVVRCRASIDSSVFLSIPLAMSAEKIPRRILKFREESPLYYPTACCECMHASSAVYICILLQLVFFFCVSLLYYLMENNHYLSAIEVFRPATILLGMVNLVGIGCALFGVVLEKSALIHVQITLLIGLVTLCDLLAFLLILTMAIGNRMRFTATIPAYFFHTDKFERLLGPFWIYLSAIMLHMTAAGTMCVIGINRRYSEFLKDKNTYQRLCEEGKIKTTDA
uniref:G_PROTEIN_RECEP_F1_2 domain-containing protein n=1 Tax=Steinernema glaseri TaxID=37863 RepID=A0A1I7YMC2_9BILA